MESVQAGLAELGLTASQTEQVLQLIQSFCNQQQQPVSSWQRAGVNDGGTEQPEGALSATTAAVLLPPGSADLLAPSTPVPASPIPPALSESFVSFHSPARASSSLSLSSTSLPEVHACEEPARFLLSDEEAYSGKLRLLVNRYLDPIKKDRNKYFGKQKVTDEPSQYDKIFSNIEEILSVHRDLNGQLLEITFSRDWSLLGGIFARYISRMNCYARYIANYRLSNATLEAIAEKRDKHKALLNLLHNVEHNDPDVMGLSLQMLLSCPLNRIAQYEVFLDRILVTTPTSEPSYKDLLEAMALLSDLQSNITHELIEAERIAPIHVAERRFFGYPGGKLDAPGRVFLKEGLLNWFQDKKDRSYWMCLFNDKILVCDSTPVAKKKDKKYKFRDEIPLQYITVEASPFAPGAKLAYFEVVSGDIHNNQTFRFSCPSEAERREWLEALSLVSSSLVKTRIFGVELDEICSREGNVVPLFVAAFIRQLNATALKTSGLYRVSGAAKQIGLCREKLDRGLDLDFHDPELDDHTLSGLLKLFFRELPRPLLCPDSAMFDKFLATIENEDTTTTELRRLIEALPANYQATTRALFAHLVQLAQHCEVNMMTASNIAIVFGPNILRSSTADHLAQARSSGDICLVVEHLIAHYSEIFPEDDGSTSASSPQKTAAPPSLATPRTPHGAPAPVSRFPPPSLTAASSSAAASSSSPASPLAANLPPPITRSDSFGSPRPPAPGRPARSVIPPPSLPTPP